MGGCFGFWGGCFYSVDSFWLLLFVWWNVKNLAMRVKIAELRSLELFSPFQQNTLQSRGYFSPRGRYCARATVSPVREGWCTAAWVAPSRCGMQEDYLLGNLLGHNIHLSSIHIWYNLEKTVAAAVKVLARSRQDLGLQNQAEPPVFSHKHTHVVRKTKATSPSSHFLQTWFQFFLQMCSPFSSVRLHGQVLNSWVLLILTIWESG